MARYAFFRSVAVSRLGFWVFRSLGLLTLGSLGLGSGLDAGLGSGLGSGLVGWLSGLLAIWLACCMQALWDLGFKVHRPQKKSLG